jgi:putative ABC transport system permease protein
MRFAAARELVVLSVRSNLRASLSSIFGLSVGISALVFFVALGLGISGLVASKIFPYDASLVEVVPSPLALGLLGGGKLDTPAVKRLMALPHVKASYAKMNVRVPAVSIYNGDFFGRPLRMGLEIAAVGVDPQLLRDTVDVDSFADFGEGQPIAVVASTRIIEIYNKTFAPVRGLPQLSFGMLKDFSFPLEFNRSMVTPVKGGNVIAATGRVCGASDRALLAGITIPLNVAKRLNAAAGVDAETLSALVLRVETPRDVPAVAAAVKAMGFELDDGDRRMAENAGAAVALTTTAFALLSLLICVLAAFNIAHAFSASVRARQKDLGIMRAVGASSGDIRGVVLSEAALLGFIGGAIGTALALGAGRLVDTLAARFLPEFPFRPETYFAAPPWLLLLGLTVGAAAAILGAWWPARRAAAVDPITVLSA